MRKRLKRKKPTSQALSKIAAASKSHAHYSCAQRRLLHKRKFLDNL